MLKYNQQHRNQDLSDVTAHDKDHKLWSRRTFLQTTGIAGGIGLGLGGFSISALATSSEAWITGGNENRILVLIRLKGGNDGLNMIVPVFDYGTYKANRPTIAISQSDLIGLDSNQMYAMPKSMAKLKPLWDQGAMKVLLSVGYPDHNLSHFTSSDIWNSANPEIDSDVNKSGWLGRYLLNGRPDYLNNLPEVPGAIKVSSGSSITFQNPDRIDLAVNFNTPDKLIEVAEKGYVYDTVNLPDDCYYGEQIGFLRSVLNITYKYAPNISKAYTDASNAVSYSDNELSRQLAIVARLIKGGLGTRLYMVTLDGFDTHENQNVQHPRLMRDISAAISEFYDDLNASGKAEDVLSMTFSEFGRRIRENEGGTDHGTAAPVMFFGPALDGHDLLGKNPDLHDMDAAGNLKFETDFRSIYATLLESWLCINASDVDTILGDTFERIPELGFSCSGTNHVTQALIQNIKHQARLLSNGCCNIVYELSRPGAVTLDIFTIMGQKVATLVNEYQQEGVHEAVFVSPNAGSNGALYHYRIQSGNEIVSGKFVLVH